MRAIRGRAIAALVGLVLAVALGPAAADASAEVLVNQQPGPSGIAVPSDDGPEFSESLDDFTVPPGAHWNLEAVRVFGAAAVQRPRTFNVRIYRGSGQSTPVLGTGDRLFSETVPAAGNGPDYLIPITGAPLLDEKLAYKAQFWISVQAVSAGGEDEWAWLTGAEPGLAFELLGTPEQILKARFIDGWASAGQVVSSPPGISCPGTCEAAFPRGTTVTLNPSPLLPSTRFTQWGFLNPGYTGPPGALVPIQVPTPCLGTTPACTFTLSKDEGVEANFEPMNEVDVLRVVLDRRRGRGELVVWVPDEGVLSTAGEAVKNQASETLPAGLARIPLVPRTPVAKRLHRKGSAKVSIAVNFRPIKSTDTGTVRRRLTLVRKPHERPSRAVH